MIPEELWTSIKEAIKEPLRLLVLGVVTVVIDWLIKNIFFISPSLEVQAIILLVLRFIDKVIHEWGVATEQPKLTTGLTRF